MNLELKWKIVTFCVIKCDELYNGFLLYVSIHVNSIIIK